MSSIKQGIAVTIALVLVATALAGCVDENGNGVEWENPTQMVIGDFSADDTNEWVVVNITLGDKSDLVTQADGTLRVAIFDDNDVEMLNKTWEIKKDDFAEWEILSVTSTAYELHIPYADITKSDDRGGTMYAMAWFTWKEETFTATWHFGWMMDPDIPDALLLPNNAPVAAVTGPTTGFTEVDIGFDATGSTDAEDSLEDLTFEWDWGDGETSFWLFAEATMTHAYEEPGTYTITVNVSDTEDAFDHAMMDITIDWALALTVEDTGVVADPGEHFNDTWYDVKIMNQASEIVSVPSLDAYLNTTPAETPMDDNGTATDPPASLGVGESVTVRVYFVVPETETPTGIEVMGRIIEL
jgi:hypothetical protein